MNKTALLWGACFGLLTVALGAFGAHALKDLLIENNRVEVFKTAVQYQSFHALALLVIGVLSKSIVSKWLTYATYVIVVGVVLFSGSLFVLSITNISIFGLITPIGGVFLMFGWFSLIIGILKKS